MVRDGCPESCLPPLPRHASILPCLPKMVELGLFFHPKSSFGFVNSSSLNFANLPVINLMSESYSIIVRSS